MFEDPILLRCPWSGKFYTYVRDLIVGKLIFNIFILARVITADEAKFWVHIF